MSICKQEGFENTVRNGWVVVRSEAVRRLQPLVNVLRATYEASLPLASTLYGAFFPVTKAAALSWIDLLETCSQVDACPV